MTPDGDHSVFEASLLRFDAKYATNEAEWAAAATILDRAANIMQRDGFQQGAIRPVSKQCLATALEQAFRDTQLSIVDFNYARAALSDHLSVAREPQALANDDLDVPYWGREFMDWNDAPGRLQADAITALRSAASQARTRSDMARLQRSDAR